MVRLWQAAICALMLLGLVNMAGQIAQLHSSGTFGFTVSSNVGASSLRTVDSVSPGSPAFNAGIRRGDVLELDSGIANRVVLTAPLPGDRLVVYDGRRRIDLTAVVDTGPQPRALLALVWTTKIAYFTMGALIAWRRPRDAAGRALAFFLVCFGTAVNFTGAIPSAIWLRAATFMATQTLLILAAWGFYTFALRFPSVPDRGLRRTMARAAVALGVVGVALALGTVMDSFFGTNGPEVFRRALRIGFIVTLLVLVFGALASLIVSYRDALGDQRPRMRWVLVTFAVGLSGLVVVLVAYMFGHGNDVQLFSATTLVIPFGLAYVILRHRMLDIGFVVNRAVVYTIVSIVVVGSFIVFEWLLGHVVEANSRASTILELLGALVLGLSTRFIHARVDRYVDDLFFRDRHIAEAAIRRFAVETGLVTDADILIHRTVDVAERNARLMGAGFFARLGKHYIPLHSTFRSTPAEIEENDATILAMRTWNDPVDMHDGTSVPGVTAFPMTVRGQLAGFLACGEKATHEALAPDERDALRVLARDAGIALDSLRIARIKQELAYLTDDGALPPDIRLRLTALLDAETASQPAGADLRSIQLIQESKTQELL